MSVVFGETVMGTKYEMRDLVERGNVVKVRE